MTAPPAQPAETPDAHGAYPRLSDDQLSRLQPLGEVSPTTTGEVLFREGDLTCDFYVVLEGSVAIVEDCGGDRRVIGVHGPGRFLGELNLLTGQAVFVTAVVQEPGRVLVIPVDRLRQLLSQDQSLGDVILHAYLARRSILIDLGTGIRIVGSRYSADARRLREFAARNRLPHRWVDLETEPDADALLRRLGVGPDETPVVLWRAQLLRNPSNAQLAGVLGLRAPAVAVASYDLVVVGAGPAGLGVAVYAASEGLATIVLDAVATGGQAGTAARIENYLGFPAGITGAELADRAAVQAEKFGARITVPARACALDRLDGHFVVHLADGDAVSGRTVVIATGVHYRKLGVARLEEFEGVSVHYAATQVEARLCRADPVVVVGGGNSAGQAALFLASQASVVRLVVRGPDLSADMSRYLADRIERTPRVGVHLDSEVRELVGGHALEVVVVENTRTGEPSELPARALFVFIGADPRTQWLGGLVARDDRGFVLTGPDTGDDGATVSRVDALANPAPWQPASLETSCAGVFAAGDVRSGSPKRVAAAVGDGAMAVRQVHDHLAREWGRVDL